jgi:molybdenum cofactor synthesis domain-containing protein
MFTVGIITVSDRSFQGARDDLSGPAIKKWAEDKKFRVAKETIVPDEKEKIKEQLMAYSDLGLNLILTTGGTGFATRDVTPEATLEVIEKNAPGLAEVMRAKSLEVTPHAMLSRAVSGIRQKSLIVNLPGSPKAVKENLQFIEPALLHGIELLQNQVKDCAS